MCAVIVSNVVGEFAASHFQAKKASAVKQLGFEPAPEKLSLRVVIFAQFIQLTCSVVIITEGEYNLIQSTFTIQPQFLTESFN